MGEALRKRWGYSLSLITEVKRSPLVQFNVVTEGRWGPFLQEARKGRSDEDFLREAEKVIKLYNSDLNWRRDIEEVAGELDEAAISFDKLTNKIKGSFYTIYYIV